MPKIPGLPEQLIDVKGVDSVPPPVEYIEETKNVIHEALKEVGQGKGIMTWVLTTKGVNLAVVDKFNDHVAVTFWVGKTWGAPLSAGVAGQVSW